MWSASKGLTPRSFHVPLGELDSHKKIFLLRVMREKSGILCRGGGLSSVVRLRLMSILVKLPK